jgi:hypothetical protein
MSFSRLAIRSTGAVLLCLGLCLPSWEAAAEDDMTELKRAIELLQAQNREMARRLAALEAERAERKQAGRLEPASKKTRSELAQKTPRTEPPRTSDNAASQPAKTEGSETLEERVKELELAKSAQQAPQIEPARTSDKAADQPAKTEGGEALEERVKQLELAKPAQEEAVRSIIRSTFSTMGSRINEFVSLGGSLEVTAERSSDFTGKYKDSVTLSTAELDLEIRANEWMVGNLTLAFDSGTSVLFPTTPAFNTGVDRVTLDKAYVTIGDIQKFPLFAKAGRDYLPFGISTGVHRADTLSIVNPLTTEAFEIRKVGVGIGFGLPTPLLAPPTPPITVPPVRPQVVGPLVGSLAKYLGYQPPAVRPKPPTPFTFPPEPPPLYGILNLYDANATDVPNRTLASSINGRLGYRAKGHCGLPYSDLTSSSVCPWSIDVNVDYDSSVFDSRFLQSEYLPFLGQIGTVPGMAGSAKASLGPFLLAGEWNGAIRAAKFVDGSGRPVSMTPGAWQGSLGYQFDWNPWVEAIGTQGNYVAIGYSHTYGLAGAVPLGGTPPTRIGSLPQGRLTVTAGEWVLENAKLALEYSRNWDYPASMGGTGKQADGFFVALTYNW